MHSVRFSSRHRQNGIVLPKNCTYTKKIARFPLQCAYASCSSFFPLVFFVHSASITPSKKCISRLSNFTLLLPPLPQYLRYVFLKVGNNKNIIEQNDFFGVYIAQSQYLQATTVCVRFFLALALMPDFFYLLSTIRGLNE